MREQLVREQLVREQLALNREACSMALKRDIVNCNLVALLLKLRRLIDTSDWWHQVPDTRYQAPGTSSRITEGRARKG